MKKYLNAEGYPDPTAYGALKDMEGFKMTPKEGDIYNIRRFDGQTSQYLFVRVFENYSLTIMLKDNLQYIQPENLLEIVSKQVMYADAGRLGYTFNDVVGEADYIRTVGAEKLWIIKQKIAETVLGGQRPAVGPEEAEKTVYSDKVENSSNEIGCTVLQAFSGDRIDPTDEGSDESDLNRALLVQYDTERQIYKDFCARLLDIIEKGAESK